ncbi:hypothetical protein JW899_05355 [Candidatus Uhrbacteria bacterium]|nr:hypothetical protein [Candidatus Uhrbacteria bacterium]
MQIPQININLDYFVQLGQLPMPALFWRLFLDGGWVLVMIVLFRIVAELWLYTRQAKYVAGQRYHLLAINVPKMNEQPPKAMEHVFATLAGTYIPTDFRDRWWLGIVQNTYSFEIVSIEGYVQFLVRTPSSARNTLEAAIYSQYPDAEIVEIEDYAATVPGTYPNETHDAFGLEFILSRPSAFPIRTHIEYEHSLSEEYFKDPMAGLLEVMGSAGPGEQLWLQFLVRPNDGSWKKASKEVVDEAIGKKKPAAKADPIAGLMEWPRLFADQVLGTESEPPKKDDKTGPKIMEMTTHDRNLLDAVQAKASKPGLDCKIRVCYVARKESFSKMKLVGGVGSSLSVLTTLDSNGIRWYTKVMPKATYPWQRPKMRRLRNAIVRNFRSRSMSAGATHFILNIEELATLYHFPFKFTKAPSVKKTDAKRAEPPPGLPFAVSGQSLTPFTEVGSRPSVPPPSAIPTVQDDDEEGEG